MGPYLLKSLSFSSKNMQEMTQNLQKLSFSDTKRTFMAFSKISATTLTTIMFIVLSGGSK
jgi:hypothetical protein